MSPDQLEDLEGMEAKLLRLPSSFGGTMGSKVERGGKSEGVGGKGGGGCVGRGRRSVRTARGGMWRPPSWRIPAPGPSTSLLSCPWRVPFGLSVL